MKEMVDALKQAFEKRLSSPIFGSLVFGFIGANHKGLALFLIGDIADRKKIISGYDVMNDLQDVLLYAFVLYVMLNVFFPLLQNGVDLFLAHTIHKVKCKADSKRRESEIWSGREAIEKGIKEKIENWEKEKAGVQAENSALKKDKSDLEAKLETESAVNEATASIVSHVKSLILDIDRAAAANLHDFKEEAKSVYNHDIRSFSGLITIMESVIKGEKLTTHSELPMSRIE